jgi:hypothetical protein
LRLPPYPFSTAASRTRWLARQMSRPVPSPSMKGMIGRSGTESFPATSAIFAPSLGTTGFASAIERDLVCEN